MGKKFFPVSGKFLNLAASLSCSGIEENRGYSSHATT